MYRATHKNIIVRIVILLILCGHQTIYSQETRSKRVEFSLNNLVDAVPPTIRILAPDIKKDTIYQTIAGEINLVGQVSDDSSIKFIAVSSEKIIISESGIFSARIELYPGENHIRLVAADAYNNLEEVFITIEYIPPPS